MTLGFRAAGERRFGVLLILVSAVAWSTAGLFTRLIGADALTIVFWRGIAGALCLLLYGAAVGGGRSTLRSFGRLSGPAWLVIACEAAGMVAYVPSLKLTTVANVAVIYATAPLFAAAIAWIWIKPASSLSAPQISR